MQRLRAVVCVLAFVTTVWLFYDNTLLSATYTPTSSVALLGNSATTTTTTDSIIVAADPDSFFGDKRNVSGVLNDLSSDLCPKFPVDPSPSNNNKRGFVAQQQCEQPGFEPIYAVMITGKNAYRERL